MCNFGFITQHISGNKKRSLVSLTHRKVRIFQTAPFGIIKMEVTCIVNQAMSQPKSTKDPN